MKKEQSFKVNICKHFVLPLNKFLLSIYLLYIMIKLHVFCWRELRTDHSYYRGMIDLQSGCLVGTLCPANNSDKEKCQEISIVLSGRPKRFPVGNVSYCCSVWKENALSCCSIYLPANLTFYHTSLSVMMCPVLGLCEEISKYHSGHHKSQTKAIFCNQKLQVKSKHRST